MPGTNLRMAAMDWERLRKHCAPSFRGRRNTESGAIGLLGKRCVQGVTRELIVSEILWPEAGDVSTTANRASTFSSRYMRRTHMAVRKKGLAGLVTFHTHPRADMDVGFSFYDDDQDPLLIENLQDLWPGTLLCSVVLGKNSQKGRLWISPGKQEAQASLVTVGESLQYLPLDGRPRKPAPNPSEIFDRALAVTGSGALAILVLHSLSS